MLKAILLQDLANPETPLAPFLAPLTTLPFFLASHFKAPLILEINVFKAREAFKYFPFLFLDWQFKTFLATLHPLDDLW